MRIRCTPDLLSGLLLVAIGAGFAWAARSYDFGSGARPGPGYFPFGLGVLLMLLGAALVAGSRREPATAPGPRVPIRWRPLLFVIGAIVLFALGVPRLGLWITLPLTVITASAASAEFRWREVLLNALVLTVASWLVFVVGLKLSLPLLPDTTPSAAPAAVPTAAPTSAP